VKNYLEILGRHQRPMKFMAARALATSGACRAFTIRQNGYRLRFYPTNVSEQLWVDPTWREPELWFFRAYLRPGDTVIDVGANIGDTALTAALCIGDTGHVWAIEPHPRTFRFLERNIALNGIGNISLIRAAAAPVSGRLHMTDDRRDDMNRIADRGTAVPAGPIDRLVPHRGPVTLLKIDVEGYELGVLRGATETLERTGCLHIEVAERHTQVFGYGAGAVLDLLLGSGFSVFALDGTDGPCPVDRTFSADCVKNLIAVRNVEELKRRTGWCAA
jgi:FkbM family methyltransferase